MKGFIYKYTFPDGKVYIGQTVRPLDTRHKEHITPSTGKVNVGFWEAWQKYGEAKLEAAEIVGSDADSLFAKLNSYERDLIEQHHSTDPQFGYNRIPGGMGPSVSRKKLVKVFNELFGELWQERSEFYTSLEEKIRQLSDSPVSLNEEEALFFHESVLSGIIPEYSQYIKLTQDGKLSFLGGDNDPDGFHLEETCSWLLFSLSELEEIESNELARSVESYLLSNPSTYLSDGIIQQVTKDGTVVKEYAFMSEIMQELNLKRSVNIYNVLEGKQKTAYGFIWRWKNKQQA